MVPSALPENSRLPSPDSARLLTAVGPDESGSPTPGMSREATLDFPMRRSACYTPSMNPRLFLDVDPRTLHLPNSRLSGADPGKLHRQIAKHGKSTHGMPVVEVYRGTDGKLLIYNGVTRATRVAKLLPGQTIRVEVIDDLSTPVGHLPTVGDKLP